MVKFFATFTHMFSVTFRPYHKWIKSSSKIFIFYILGCSARQCIRLFQKSEPNPQSWTSHLLLIFYQLIKLWHLGRIFLHQLSSHLESHLNCYFFWHLMSIFLNVNCHYLAILFNEIEVWAGIEACFATVKYSIYCLKTPKKRQRTFKKFDIRCQKK
jgi:hypothetical protein